jgi:hypothetical protein
MNSNYPILINTTDSFEDCWVPFFTLFKKYWPDYTGTIYLNTETKDFIYEGLRIVCVKNNLNKSLNNISWSNCLYRALNFIDGDVILYMQEDYFLKDFVKGEIVEDYVELINNNPEIDCIHLTDQAVINDLKSSKFEGLFTALRDQRYLVSCQAALWRKTAMLSLLRIHESAWQFEEFGSKRASVQDVRIYGVDKDWVKIGKNEIIPYIFTGIIQGRWYDPVIKLFEENSIDVDYSKRGFVSQTPPRSFKLKLFNRWRRSIAYVKCELELFSLEITRRNRKHNLLQKIKKHTCPK